MSGSHQNPAQAARKAMDPDDPDFMAKRVPLLDIMKKMQNIEASFPKMKKMEVVVQRNSAVIAEVNMKLRSAVTQEQLDERFHQMNVQFKRQYEKDVQIYQEKMNEFLKNKLDIDQFNKRMRSKVNSYDFDVILKFFLNFVQQKLSRRVIDLEEQIRTSISIKIEGQRRQFKKALEEKASLTYVDEQIQSKAQNVRVEEMVDRIDRLQSTVNHMRLMDNDDESDQVIDSEQEFDDFNDEGIQMPESKPIFQPPQAQGSGGFPAIAGGALQKKPQDKKQEQKKGEEEKKKQGEEDAKKEKDAKTEEKKEEDASAKAAEAAAAQAQAAKAAAQAAQEQKNKEAAAAAQEQAKKKAAEEAQAKQAQSKPPDSGAPQSLTIDAVKKLDATSDVQQGILSIMALLGLRRRRVKEQGHKQAQCEEVRSL